MKDNELSALMVNELDYLPAQVGETIQKLRSMDGAIIEAFDFWLESRQYKDEPVFSGCTPHSLAVTYPFFKPPAIFLLLDWIRRDPITALSSLKDEYDRLPDGYQVVERNESDNS